MYTLGIEYTIDTVPERKLSPKERWSEGLCIYCVFNCKIYIVSQTSKIYYTRRIRYEVKQRGKIVDLI